MCASVCTPEVLGASRADVLVQVVPLVFLQSLMAKLHPARHKLSISVWRAQAVAVVDLSRLIWVPKTTEKKTLQHTTVVLPYMYEKYAIPKIKFRKKFKQANSVYAPSLLNFGPIEILIWV